MPARPFPFLLFLLLLSPLPAGDAGGDAPRPTDEMASQTRWVVSTINSRHYLRATMSELDGDEMVRAYVESFDYTRMYFLQSDIEDFAFRFAGAMENFLEKGNLYAAFEIYDAFRERAKARTEWVDRRLEEDFDFTDDQSFLPDRREAEWPATQEEADDLWERRLEYELLNEVLSLAAETTAAEDGAVLERINPDVAREEDEFDPAKLRKLLDDPEFLAANLDEARDKIRRRYERNLNHTLDREAAEVQESFINSMTQLFDPHSTFLSADTLEGFNTSVQNSFVGIGALLADEDGICTIKQILPGGPAERSGELREEDQILAVAEGADGEFEDVIDMELRYIVRRIKGERNTVVRLLVRPADAADPSVRRVISIVRDEVKLTANLASARLIEVPREDGGAVPVGVIEVPSFYGNIGAGDTLTTTADDVRELIGKLKEMGAEGLVLDLRMNGGGLLSEAIRVAGLFIPIGPVVQVRDYEGDVAVLSDYEPEVVWSGPLVVLTSRFSASASEIVAGALRDHDRALIVGNSSTHGKGTVQEVYHMNNRGAFSWLTPMAAQTRPVASKITIKQFYLPDGSSTQLKGVPSDIVLPSANEFLPIGESDLPHALPWDAIEDLGWSHDWAEIEVQSPDDPALVDFLAAESARRQESLEEFTYLKKQIDWRRQRFEEKEVSLNLEKRIERKVSEQGFVDELDDNYEALSEDDYPSTDILLAIAEEQEAISRRNLEKNGSEKAGKADDDFAVVVAEEEDEEEPFDIYRREAARIMADWVTYNPAPAETAGVSQDEARAN